MATIDTIPARPKSAYTMLSTFRRWGAAACKGVLGWLKLCSHRYRSRLDLLELTDEQLADIGVSKNEARREGLRPFWD